MHTHSCVFFDNLIQGFLLRWTFYSHCDVQRTICFRHGMTGGCFRSKVYTAGLSYSLELKCCRPHTPFWLVVLAVYRRWINLLICKCSLVETRSHFSIFLALMLSILSPDVMSSGSLGSRHQLSPFTCVCCCSRLLSFILPPFLTSIYFLFLRAPYWLKFCRSIFEQGSVLTVISEHYVYNYSSLILANSLDLCL